MIEHRLIERMVKVMKHEIEAIGRTGKARPEFIDEAIDFMKTFADRCHHGKEEGLLFAQLSEKRITDHYKQTVDELVQEHARARSLTANLVDAKRRYVSGDAGALEEIRASMKTLVDFYPLHIEKEDRHFFIPCMEYFSQREQDLMLESFSEFDRTLIHEKYRGVIERFEGKK
jgi:hemerythrin-like domain-containing protein